MDWSWLLTCDFLSAYFSLVLTGNGISLGDSLVARVRTTNSSSVIKL